MKLDNGSLMFNLLIEEKGSTPSWGTSLGQSEKLEYRFTKDDYSDLITSMVYKKIPDIENLKFTLGKPGADQSNYEIVLAALYTKIYVNDELIDNTKFILVLSKELVGANKGRSTLKYNPKIYYKGVSNEESYKNIREKFDVSEKGAWFVTEIYTKNQDELHFKAFFVSKNGPISFKNGEERKKYIEDIMNNNLKERYKKWLSDNHYEGSSITTYPNVLNKLSTEKYINGSIYNISDPKTLEKLIKDLNNNEKFKEYNNYYSHGAILCSLKAYNKFLVEINNKNNDFIKGGFNIIYYGVPGTGKSYQVQQYLKTKDVAEDEYIRTTFYPEYSYNDFIGQLLPKVETNGDNKNITYDFKEGPFTKALKLAYSKPNRMIYLIIEEMSRGNCSAIFGDIFQLLDRVQEDNEDKDWSAYSIDNELISEYIPQITDDKIRIPSNLSIIGTLNTSDQNVFVMDNAFKRRFEWEYVDTTPVKDDTGKELNNVKITINTGSESINTNWIEFYQKLNKFISSSEGLGLSEDKQIGQFFIEFDNETDQDKIKNKLQNKLLHYLWFDVKEACYKTSPILFNEKISCFSELYNRFKNNNVIFSNDFLNNFKNETVIEE